MNALLDDLLSLYVTASKVKELYVGGSGISYSDSEDDTARRARNASLGGQRRRGEGNYSKAAREDQDGVISEQETPPDLARQTKKRSREHYDPREDSVRNFSPIFGSRAHDNRPPPPPRCRDDDWYHDELPRSRNDKSLVPRDIMICSLGKCTGCGGVMHGHISGIACGRCSYATSKHKASAFSPGARSTSASPPWKRRRVFDPYRPNTHRSYTDIPDFRSPIDANASRRRESSKYGGNENTENMGYKTPPSYRARKDEDADKSEAFPMSPEQVTQAEDAMQSNESNEMSVESPELMRGGNDSSSLARGNAPGSAQSAASDDVFEAALAFVKKLQVNYGTVVPLTFTSYHATVTWYLYMCMHPACEHARMGS
jgi:hypothetical protein